MIKKHIDKILIAVLALIQTFYYRYWISPANIISDGDWEYFINNDINYWGDYAHLWDGRGLGGVHKTPFFNVIAELIKYASNLGADWDIIVRIFFLYPLIFIFPVVLYYLFLQISRSHIGSFIASLLFLSSNYIFYLNSGHLTLSMSFLFVTLSLLALIRYTHYQVNSDLIILTFSLFWSGAYDIRGVYIFVILHVLYTIYYYLSNDISPQRLLKSQYLTLISYFTLITLNLYWIIPYINLDSISSNSAIRSVLFGSEYFVLSNAMSISHSFWNGREFINFTLQEVPFIMWLIPVTIIVIILRDILLQNNNKKWLFGLMVYLTGIFLSKQTAPPFSQTYQFLFEHVPGFNMFREASKFNYLSILGFGMIISLAFVNKNKNEKWLKYFIGFAASLLIIVQAYPIISNSYSKLYEPKSIHRDYASVNQFIKEKNQTRLLWVPSKSRWAYTTPDITSISIQDLISNIPTDIYEFPETSDPKYIEKLHSDILTKPYALDLLRSNNVEYIVLPDYSLDDIHKIYGSKDKKNTYDYYYYILESLSYLERVNIGTKEVFVYKILYDKPPNSFLKNVVNIQSQEIYLNLNKYSINYDTIISQPALTKDTINIQTLRDFFEAKQEINSKSKLLFGEYQNIIFKKYLDNDTIEIVSTNIIDLLSNDILSGNVLLTVPKAEESKFYIEQNNRIVNLSQLRIFSVKNDTQIKILKAGENLIKNGDFEEGLWQESVSNCNNYDNDPQINMELGVKNLNNYLILESLRHTACTNTTVSLEEASKYIISGLVKSNQNSPFIVGVTILSDNNQITTSSNDVTIFKNNVFKREFIPSNSNWNTYDTMISIPEGVDKVDISLQTPSGQRVVKQFFDNFTLKQLKVIYEKDIFHKNYEQTIKLNNELLDTYIKNIKNINNLNHSEHNHIRNGSFEKGLWKEKVDNCNMFDNKDPQINMKLMNDNNENYLKLVSGYHTACTSIQIPIKGLEVADIIFDSRSRLGSQTKVGITSGDKTKFYYFGNTSEWQSNFIKYEIPSNIDFITLTIYAEYDGFSSGSEIHYKDFRLSEDFLVNLNNYIVTDLITEQSKWLTNFNSYNPNWIALNKLKPVQSLFNTNVWNISNAESGNLLTNNANIKQAVYFTWSDFYDKALTITTISSMLLTAVALSALIYKYINQKNKT